jgi:hypothetical protein
MGIFLPIVYQPINLISMIRRIFFIGLMCSSLTAFCQEPADALRYSWLTPYGTARSMAIGGALTSLGGDITSTYVNPAGIGLFKTGELVVSPGFSFRSNSFNYLGSAQSAKQSNLNFGTTGIIIPSAGSKDGKWRNFTYAIAINRTADFNNKTDYKGLNRSSSYSEKYLEELINNNITDPNKAAVNYPFGTSLAFNTYLIDTINSGGNVVGYKTLATPQTGLNQTQTIETTGGINTLAFAGSANFEDKLYLGATIGIDYLTYNREQTFTEQDATTNKLNYFNSFSVQESLNTVGTGINLKLGLIYKPVDYLRMGLAIHTPTMYNLKDTYSTTITTDLEGYGGQGVLKQSSNDLVNAPGTFQYVHNNPLRVMAGISYVFREVNDVTKQRAFISGDVEYVDYGSSTFREADVSTNAYFKDLNSIIGTEYKRVLNVKLGGELKFNTIMVRGGFAYFPNPYTNSEFKGSKMNISGGLGYRNKGIFIDATFVQQLVTDGFYPYRLQDSNFFPVTNTSGIGSILFTVGCKF